MLVVLVVFILDSPSNGCVSIVLCRGAGQGKNLCPRCILAFEYVGRRERERAREREERGKERREREREREKGGEEG